MDFSQFWFQSKDSGDLGDPIANSLRFRGAQHLEHTFTTTGNRETFTISFWVKQSQFGVTNQWASAFNDGSDSGNFTVGHADAGEFQAGLFNRGAFTSPGKYRDPAAWYHIVVSVDGTDGHFYINGEELTDPNAQWNAQYAWNAACLHRIGRNSFNTNFPCVGYLAEFYSIDGQTLDPTTFGRYNENDVWVPVDPQLDSTEVKYSDFLTPTVPGSWDDGDVTNVFDGLTTTYAGTGTNGTWTFAPTTDIEVGTQVRVFALNTGGTISWNGQTVTPNGGWATLTASGVINADTPLVGTTVGTGQSSFVNAIEVDGVILTNPYLWSTDLYTFQGSQNVLDNGPSAADLASTDKDFLPGSPVIYGFDGNSATYVYSDLSHGWVFRPSTAIENVTKIEIRNGTGERVWINGDISANFGNDTPRVYYDGPAITLETIAGLYGSTYTPSTSSGFGEIWINDQLYVDGANPSYGPNGFHLDFADPSNIGKDISGNGNDFTATGFDLSPPGVWSNYVYTGVNGSTSFEWDATGKDFSPGSGPELGFNNQDTNTGTQNNGSLIFRPNTPLTGITEIAVEVGPTSTYILGLNGADVASQDAMGSSGYKRVQLPDGFDGTVSSFGLRNTNSGDISAFSRLRINGTTVLVDNTGTDYDLMLDSPTQNFATGNPLHMPTATREFVPSFANLGNDQSSGGVFGGLQPTMPWDADEQWYFEVKVSNYPFNTWFGFNGNPGPNAQVGSTGAGVSNGVIHWAMNGGSALNTMGTANGPFTGITWTPNYTVQENVVAGWEWDGTNRRIRYYENGVLKSTSSQWDAGSFDTANFLFGYNSAPTTNWTYNFGQQPFINRPAGLTDDNNLQTQNLPAAKIANAREHFQAITGPGIGEDLELTGDFVTYLSADGGFLGGYTTSDAFDGDTSTQVFGATNGGGMSFAPTTPITVNYEVAWFSNSDATNNFIRWNGTDVPRVFQNWTVVSGSGEISASNPVEFIGSGNGGDTTPSITALRVDGKILVNSLARGGWSPDLYRDPTNTATPNYNSTDQDITEAYKAFNGILTQSCSSAGVYGDWLIFRPSTPITVNSSLKLNPRFPTSDITVNEVSTGINSTVVAREDLLDLSSALTFPLTLTSLAVRGDGSASYNSFLAAVEIDGVILQDGEMAGNYSSYVTTNPSTYYPNTSPADMFDGTVSTYLQTNDPSGSSSITFIPPTPIPYTKSVEIYFGGPNVSLNGGANQTPTVNTWSTIATGSGEITSLVFTGGYGGTVYGIKVDGKVLVDYGILAQAQTTFPNGLWWIKTRPSAMQHQFVDSVRGGNLALTCPAKSRQDDYSVPSDECVAWCWKTNENGINTDAGFQILTYTGVDASSQTIPHNLDPTKPLDLVILKAYDAPESSTYVNDANWLIWHKDLAPNSYAYLNTSGALTSISNGFWTSTGLNTTLGNLTVGSDPDVNNGPSVRGGAIEYVAYLWQSVPNYSAFGSYQGNGSTDGVFVSLPFRPAFVMTKNVTAASDWLILDTTRDQHNPSTQGLLPNDAMGELSLTGGGVDIVSNGFKARQAGSFINDYSTYIYCAFAESPFGGENTPPATAR